MAETMLLQLWKGVTRAAPGLLAQMATRAHRRMQAPEARLSERFGVAGAPRPEGALVWLHAASMGEVASVLSLARLIMAETGATVLMTTTSATGAEVVARRLPEALHQFAPIDTPAAVARFLDHWQPMAALFVEGDLWPRMMAELVKRRIPAALLNARASKTRSRAPRSFAALLQGVALITLQSEDLKAGFLALGISAAKIAAPGNLKADILAPTADPELARRLREGAGPRPIWAAASTHAGEDEIVLDALAKLPHESLLILAPRHPERGDDVAAELARRGLRVTRHSAGELPGPQTQVHLVDQMGLMGTVYEVAALALIGGSLLPGPEGHTPYEPAAIGAAILSGPHIRNFAAAYGALEAQGASLRVTDAATLAEAVAALLADPARLSHMCEAARSEQARHEGASRRTLALLAPILGRQVAAEVQPNEFA